MKHKHADLLIAIANGEQIQMKYENQWKDCTTPGLLFSIIDDTLQWEWRIKPKTILINGIEVREPIREPLNSGDLYYIPFLTKMGNRYYQRVWNYSDLDVQILNYGLVHRTAKDADTHAEALLSFTRNV